MNIDGPTLSAQVDSALTAWPFIAMVEQRRQLPPFLLLAVGSRETNLTNEVGDGGHGHGVWQLDNRSHQIPAGFDANVREQCSTAAAMLDGLFTTFSDQAEGAQQIRCVLAAYNAGAGTVRYNLAHGLSVDTGTAHDDYSSDTYARMEWLMANYPITLSQSERTALAAAIAAQIEPHIPLRYFNFGTDQHPYALRTWLSELATVILGKPTQVTLPAPAPAHRAAEQVQPPAAT